MTEGAVVHEKDHPIIKTTIDTVLINLAWAIAEIQTYKRFNTGNPYRIFQYFNKNFCTLINLTCLHKDLKNNKIVDQVISWRDTETQYESGKEYIFYDGVDLALEYERLLVDTGIISITSK